MELDEKFERVKELHQSNFIFWVLGKFLIGLGIGILLPVYIGGAGWYIVGWMLIVFAIILMVPAMSTVFKKKRR
jgi:hypothetical protein